MPPAGFVKKPCSVSPPAGGTIKETPQHSGAVCLGMLSFQPRSVTDAGGDDLAHVPRAGEIPRHGLALLFVMEGKLHRVAAAVQTLHIQAPAVFLLNHTGAVAQGAVK